MGPKGSEKWLLGGARGLSFWTKGAPGDLKGLSSHHKGAPQVILTTTSVPLTHRILHFHSFHNFLHVFVFSNITLNL